MPALDHSSRLSRFKNNNRLEDSRRRRAEVTVELRKVKKDDQLLKRRNINLEEYPLSPEKDEISMNIEQIIEGMNSTDEHTILQATQACRKMLSRQTNPPIDIMIEKGIVPKCVQFLNNITNATVQFEAAWVLTNIASGTKAQTKVVIDNEAVPALIKLLRSNHMTVVEQAVWALGNIAGDSHEARNIIFLYNPMQHLVRVCNNESTLSLVRNVVWTISNLCRSKENEKNDLIKLALPLLRDLLTCNDKDVVSDTCWSWSYLTDGSNEKIQMCIEAKIVPYLVNLIEASDDPAILTPALRAIGNIVTGTDAQTDIVIQHGALDRLEKLLRHEKRNLVKEAAWTISNVTAGNSNQIQSVIDARLIEPLIEVMLFGDPKSKKEASYAIMNITSGGTIQQIAHLIHSNIISPLCDLLESNDINMLIVVLDALTNILKAAANEGDIDNICLMIEECGGLDKIERLQHHENASIYKKSVQMIESYFSEGNEENIAPDGHYDGDGNGNQFSFHIPENTSSGFKF